jgi:hypothetical protein
MSGSGIQHPTSRRAPSPYVQFEGRKCNNADIKPVADSRVSLRRDFFGANYAPSSQALKQKRSVQTHARAIVRERVAAWEGQTFEEADSVGVPETFNRRGRR